MGCTVAMWSILLSDLPPLTHLRISAIFIKIVFQRDSPANGNGHASLFKFPKVRNFSDLERLPNHLPRTNTETTVTLLPISQLALQKMPPLVTKKVRYSEISNQHSAVTVGDFRQHNTEIWFGTWNDNYYAIKSAHEWYGPTQHTSVQCRINLRAQSYLLFPITSSRR